jgi:LuxR family maltose regulon positive regulatory protein
MQRHAAPWRPSGGPPPLPGGLVERPRLIRQVERSVARPLTLVAATAGAGKTTLLSAWAREHPGVAAVGWVTLGPAEATTDGLWRALVAALGSAALGGPAPTTPEELAARVVESVSGLRRPVALVLDQHHEAASETVAATLRHILGRPSALRVLLSTRSDPALPLQRQRLGEQLAEIRSADLTFTAGEAAELLRGQGVVLAAPQLDALVARTEGWAAGLRLAALMLADEPDPEAVVADFAGDDRAVVSYLIEEVLDHQPAAVRELLLRTAVVDRISGPLADALVGAPGSQTVLEDLVHRNALVVPLDRHGRWFRCHALFADLLRAQLAARGETAVAEQHRRAARWFAAEGEAVEALEHGVRAGDWDTVGSVLVGQWLRLRADGGGARIDAALAAMPATCLARRPHLALIAAARCFDGGDAERGETLLHAAVAGESRLAGRRRALFLRELALVRLRRARAAGDVVAGLREEAAARTALEGDIARDRCSRALARLELGRLRIAAGDDTAEGDLRAAEDLARAGGSGTIAARARAERALLYALNGRVGDASLVLETVLGNANGGGAPAAAELAQAIAGAEVGSTVLAATALARARDAAARHRGDCRLRALQRALAEGRLAVQAEPEAVRAAADALDAALADGPVPPRYAALAAAAGLRLRIRMGLAPAPDPSPEAVGEPAFEIAAALALLADGDTVAARRRAQAVAERPGVAAVRSAGALAVAAVAAHLDGEPARAAALAERALDRAEPEGLRLALVEAAPGIEPVLAHLLRYGTAHRSLIGEVLELIRSGATRRAAGATPLREELSGRELAVLRYLPTMLTSQEIAGELFVSLNTVKSHLKNIYRKLDADGRRDAVRRARELGLVAPGGLPSTQRR